MQLYDIDAPRRYGAASRMTTWKRKVCLWRPDLESWGTGDFMHRAVQGNESRRCEKAMLRDMSVIAAAQA